MNDFVKAGLVYLPIYLFAQMLSDHYGLPAFLMGWVACAVAFGIRTEGPEWWRADRYKTHGTPVR